MIPPKYIFEGDEDKARTLKGFAQSQLEILRNVMSFQSLTQDKRTVKFDDGSIIDLNINHGLETAIIYCPPIEVIEEEVPEEVEEERPWLENPGSKLRQKSNASLFLCAEYPEIKFTAYPTNIMRNEERGLVLQGGIYPYFWSVDGSGYWFDKDFTLKETEGHVLPPICLGGDYHGTMPNKPGRGGIMQSQCEAGGGLWLYRGDATLFTDGTVCGPATVSIIDICENTGKVVIPWEYPLDWSYVDVYDTVARGSSIPLSVEGGVPPYTWEALTGEAYTLSRGGMTEGNPTTIPWPRAYLNAPDDACEGTVVQVTDDCGAVVSRMIELEEAEDLTWDYVLSDEEADQGDCASVFIRGGYPPYTWESSDPEFVLTYEETFDTSNSVCLTAVACGSTIITVTDSCGNMCTGAVRSTAGQWVKVQENYSAGWGGTCYFDLVSCGGGSREIIEGYRKWLLSQPECVYYRTDDGTACIIAGVWGGPAENHPPCSPPPGGCHPSPAYCGPGAPFGSLGCVYKKYTYYEWEC